MKTVFNSTSGPSPVAPDPPGPPSERTPRMPNDERLTQLRPGEHAVVVAVDDSGPIGRRLLDLGLLPGTPVRAVRHAPLGDPGIYELRGYRLCLRRSETDRIHVQRDASPDTP